MSLAKPAPEGGRRLRAADECATVRHTAGPSVLVRARVPYRQGRPRIGPTPDVLKAGSIRAMFAVR